MVKKLNEIFETDSDVRITGVTTDSRKTGPGDLFVCTKGVTADRHDFIEKAVRNGAAAVVVSRDDIKTSVPVIKVTDTNEQLPKICAEFYDHPERSLALIGVTGTDGKTSVATIIQALAGDENCGYIGTNGARCRGYSSPTENTTPDADILYKFYYFFREAGCKAVAMETSSEAFLRGRLRDTKFNISVMTNITSDHMNIHKTFENYIDCKSMLFQQTKKSGISVLNADDEHYDYIRKKCNASNIYTYGKNKNADMVISDFRLRPDGTDVKYLYEGGTIELSSPLVGEFNVYNLAAALLTLLKTGADPADIRKRLPGVRIAGRTENIPTGSDYFVMVDYAHTPNGMSKILDFVSTLGMKHVITVAGSAGERDFTKRPEMGRILAENSSYVFFTSEDPRSEDPIQIAQMMISGIPDDLDDFEICTDRRKAIVSAIMRAGPGDIVLVLGKGDENYEKLNTGTVEFNDIREAKEAIRRKNGEISDGTSEKQQPEKGI